MTMKTITMKVSELKQAISELADDTDVYFRIASGCCGDYEDLELIELEVNKKTGDGSILDQEYCILHFNSLPGYKSCIQAGQTKKADEKYWEDNKKR
jgi:hypothetical protein